MNIPISHVQYGIKLYFFKNKIKPNQNEVKINALTKIQ